MTNRTPKTTSGRRTLIRMCWANGEIVILTLVSLVTTGCSSQTRAILPAPAQLVHTEQYVTIKGNDSSSFELVTYCPHAIQADVSVPSQRVNVHYELFFGSDLYPTNLNMAIWRD